MSSFRITDSPALARVVERQLRNWELAREQRLASAEPSPPDVADFITLTRRVGAGGQDVAELLGERLGWPVLDKQILNAMAGDDRLRRQVYESLDERGISWCEETLRSLMHSTFSRNDYFRRLSESVLSLARQGSAVFLGRAADLILPRTMGLRVGLVAAEETCAGRFAQRTGMPIEEARAQIARLEQERGEFIRQHFHVEANDATRLDLVINTDRMTTEQAVDVILAAHEVRCGSGERAHTGAAQAV